MPNQALVHINLMQERIESGVFYFQGGNNDPMNKFVQESVSSHKSRLLVCISVVAYDTCVVL